MAFDPKSTYRQASFGPCVFDIVSTQDRFGHRTAVHEYPERDIPWSERLGRKARVFRINAAIRGENHASDGLDLIEKSECGAIERLVHPLYGEHDCILIDCVPSNDPCGKAGETLFSLTFIEAGEFIFPSVTAIQGRNTAGATPGFANTVFTTIVFPVSGSNDLALFAFILDTALTLRGLFNRFIDWDSDTVDIANDLDEVIATPQQYTDAEFADVIRRAIEGIYTSANTPQDAVTALCGLLDYGVGSTGSNAEYALYVRLFALSYAATAALDAGYTNPVEAIAFMECLIGWADYNAQVAADLCFDEIYTQIMCLISAISADFRFIAFGLPPVIRRELCRSLPSVVAAYEVFGNLDTLEGFEDLNGVRNSMFMPVEVLYQNQ